MTRLRAWVAVAALALLALLALLVAGRGEALLFNPSFEAETSNPTINVNADLSLRFIQGPNEHLHFFFTFDIPPDFDFANVTIDVETVGDGTLIVNHLCDGSVGDTFPFTILEVAPGMGLKAQYQTVGLPPGIGEMTLFLKEDPPGSGHTIEVLLFSTDPLCTPLDLTFTFNGLSSPGGLPVVTNPSTSGEYILSVTFPSLFHGEEGAGECANDIDDDGDNIVNDGCPAVDAGENDPEDLLTGGPNCTNDIDDDSDGYVNDGCPARADPAVSRDDTICIGSCPTPTATATATATATPEPGADSDGDGVPDSSDNCPNTPNPSQADWNVDGIGDACQDSDGDSMGLSGIQPDGACPAPTTAMPRLRDCIELRLGTFPGVACPATASPNDENPDAFGPDLDDSQNVNGFDAFLLAQRFGSTTSSTADGKLPYEPRPDFNADDVINSLDLFVLALYFNDTCL